MESDSFGGREDDEENQFGFVVTSYKFPTQDEVVSTITHSSAYQGILRNYDLKVSPWLPNFFRSLHCNSMVCRANPDYSQCISLCAQISIIKACIS